MTDQPTYDPNRATTDAALAQLKQKQDKRAFWTKVAGGLITFAILIRAGFALFGSHELTCTASNTLDTLKTSINEKMAQDKPGVTVTTIDGIAQLSRDNGNSSCTAHLMLSDQSSHTVNYQTTKDQVEWSFTF